MAQTKPAIDTIWGSTGSTTDPGATKMNLGWVAEIPTHPVQNFWQQRADEMLTHINEQGIPVHDVVTDYPVDAWAKGSDGSVYVSLQTPNINQNPTSVPAYWELLADSINAAAGGSTGSNANGNFQIDADGTIHQWGRVVIVSGSQTLTFPTAFTSAASVSVVLSEYQSGDTGGFASVSGFGGLPTTTTVALSLATAHDEVFWMATGE